MTSVRRARCPACSKLRDVDRQRELRRVEVQWFRAKARNLSADDPFRPHEDGMRALALQGHDLWFWACDRCLREGRALIADPLRQNLGMGTPMAAYVARAFRCAACGAEAVFSPREQRHWFEELRFIIWSRPKRCPSCRRELRCREDANDRLARALRNLDPMVADELQAIAELYDELGSPDKAAQYRARAANRLKR